METALIRILLVDDHTLFRKGLAGLLNKEDSLEVVGEAQNGEEAVARALQLKPDVILMDISMPGMDGIAAAQKIREAVPSTKIIMLTILEEDKKLFEAIKAGAHGYLLKNVSPVNLFQTIRGVVHGEAAISGITAAKILREFTRQAREGSTNKHEEQLSTREIEVLQLLTKGLTNKEIGNTLKIAENTVKNHVRNILEKLHLVNRVQAAAYALEKRVVSDDKPVKA
ncbi:MAG: response regulator transcription factor [Deltaproteobacteria bacterium]|nr:response regulator transcription factor [Deltaproteobacteria bacterium]